MSGGERSSVCNAANVLFCCRVGCNPLALMSRRAPSSVSAVRWLRISPDRGCNGGFVAMLWHTSVKREAVMSRISLCLMVGKPTVWQIMAWSTENVAPQPQD